MMDNGLELSGTVWNELEIRREAGSVRVSGSFPYRRRAVLSDGGRRGRPQKEEFAPRAFAFRVNDPDAEIHFLSGHRFDKPLASKQNGTLSLEDTASALLFVATITRGVAETNHGRDALALLESGLATGISPGFRLPPERAVPRDEAEEIVTEPDDPENGMNAAQIRVVKQALLFELSLVTAPAFKDAQAELRSAKSNQTRIEPPAFLRRWRY